MLQTNTSRQHLPYYDYSEMSDFSTNQLPPKSHDRWQYVLCQTPWVKCFFYIQKYTKVFMANYDNFVRFLSTNSLPRMASKPCIYHVSIPNSNHLIQHKCYVCVPLPILNKNFLGQTNIFYNTMLPVGLSHTQQKFLTSTETETV